MDTNEFKSKVDDWAEKMSKDEFPFVLVAMSPEGMIISGNASNLAKVLAEAYGQAYVMELVNKGALKLADTH